MRRATGVRPSKHPRGGYWYHDVENPSIEVPFHEYERRYLEEVANATRFIDSVTARAWADEAAAEAAASSVQLSVTCDCYLSCRGQVGMEHPHASDYFELLREPFE